MTALLVSRVFPPATGGSGRWFHEVYSRLPRESVVVAAGEHRRAGEFDAATGLRIRRLPLSLPTWGYFSLRGFGGYRRLFRTLKRLVREEGIRSVHAGCVLPEGWLAWMLGRWRGLPYSVFVHGEELNIGRQSRELGWMMRRVFARAERVIVNSRNTERLLADGWGVAAGRVTVLHPGVDTERFVPEGGRRKAEGGNQRSEVGETTHPFTPSPRHPLTLLTVGRLQKRKGQDMLIRALPRIRDAVPGAVYEIVGDGDQRPALERLARETGVADCVRFVGEIGDAGLVRAYQQCDLFVLPNREVDGDIEGFGMVLVEAQACGKPVIAGDSGGTAETMRRGVTGEIVDCTSPEPLAAAVIALLGDAARRERMGRAAREWAVARFDWSALTARAAELFGLTADERPLERRNVAVPVG
jgi:phosphatidyl-myo-inositol dimannoside synthase